MSWYQVVIEGEQYIANMKAAALINKFEAAYRTAGVPANVKVFKYTTTTGANIYVFSPMAFEVGREILLYYNATPCLDPKEIPNLQIIHL